MSVINQMLKDLDKRSEQQPHPKATVVLPTKVHSPFILIIVTVLVMLLLTASAFYAWNSYQNKQVLDENSLNKSIQVAAGNNEIAQTSLPIQPLPESSLPIQEKSSVEIDEKISTSVIEKAVSPHTSITTPSINKPIDEPIVSEKPILNEKATNVTSDHGRVAQNQNRTTNTSDVNKNNTELNKKSSLTISRKQLTPQALSKQKMDKAERAIAENNLTQAEQLFEEVLLIMPEHHVARQQLSALLFGRKLYQPAINLLQQGIVTTPDNHTFRLMKARIHLTLKQTEQAFDALSPLAHIRDIEYQTILASTAQQINHFTAAIKSYLVLITMEPQQARHWLGLAIAYDSNSEFIEAFKAYQQAIQQGGLSNAAVNFIQQRLVELGE